MSAFDIAGAVVATPLAVIFLIVFNYGLRHDHRASGTLNSFILAVGCALWSAFCIARLCGATL